MYIVIYCLQSTFRKILPLGPQKSSVIRWNNNSTSVLWRKRLRQRFKWVALDFWLLVGVFPLYYILIKYEEHKKAFLHKYIALHKLSITTDIMPL